MPEVQRPVPFLVLSVVLSGALFGVAPAQSTTDLTAYRTTESELLHRLERELAGVEAAWLASPEARQALVDRCDEGIDGNFPTTREALLRALALGGYSTEAMRSIAGTADVFVPKCRICDGSRSILDPKGSPPRAEVLDLFVPRPASVESLAGMGDLAALGEALDDLTRHRSTLPSVLPQEAWAALVAEQSRIEAFMEFMGQALAASGERYRRIDPELARRIEESFDREREKMNTLALNLFARKVCYFCTAGADGLAEREVDR